MRIQLYNRRHSEGGGTPTAGIRILWMSGLQETGGTDCRAALAMTRLSEDCKNYKYHVKFDILHIFCAGCAIVCMSTGTRNPEKNERRKRHVDRCLCCRCCCSCDCRIHHHPLIIITNLRKEKTPMLVTAAVLAAAAVVAAAAFIIIL